MSRRHKIIIGLVVAAVAGFTLLQLFPISNFIPTAAFPGNPTVDPQFEWDSARTELLVRAACYDCHSNETRYPWYGNIAPVSWLVYHDINVGRENLNFSTWTAREIEVDNLIDQIEKGNMPKSIYLPMHPEAQLTAEQKAQLIAGLRATFEG
jgi:hypothetical protein